MQNINPLSLAAHPKTYSVTNIVNQSTEDGSNFGRKLLQLFDLIASFAQFHHQTIVTNQVTNSD